METLRPVFALALFGACTTSLPTSTTEQLVTLDPASGTGFVGKGAVQSRFGWNNAGLQANAAGITFSMDVSATYAQSCLHLTGNKEHTVEKTFKKTVELASEVESVARRNPQVKVTGFLLTGISGEGLTPPTDLCNPGQSEPEDVWIPDPAGPYPTVTLVAGTGATLMVHFGGESHPIPLSDDEAD